MKWNICDVNTLSHWITLIIRDIAILPFVSAPLLLYPTRSGLFMWEIAVVLLTLSPCVYLWESGFHLCSFTPNHSLVWKSGKMERQMEHIKNIYTHTHTEWLTNSCQNDSGHYPCTWISFVKLRVNRFLHDFWLLSNFHFVFMPVNFVASHFSWYTFEDCPNKFSISQGVWKRSNTLYSHDLKRCSPTL